MDPLWYTRYRPPISHCAINFIMWTAKIWDFMFNMLCFHVHVIITQAKSRFIFTATISDQNKTNLMHKRWWVTIDPDDSEVLDRWRAIHMSSLPSSSDNRSCRFGCFFSLSIVCLTLCFMRLLSALVTCHIVSRSYSTCLLTNNLTHCLQVILHLPVNKQPHSTLSPGHTPLACQQTTSLHIVSRSYSTCLSTNNLTPHCLQVILHLPVNKQPHSTLSPGHTPLDCQQTTSLHIVSRSYSTCLLTNKLTHCLQVILHLTVNKQPHSLSSGHTPLDCQQTTSLHIVSRSYSTWLSTNNLTPHCLQVIIHLPVNKQPHSTLSPGHTPLACQQTTSLHIVSRSHSTCLSTNNLTPHCLQVILHLTVNKQTHSTLSPGHTPLAC